MPDRDKNEREPIAPEDTQVMPPVSEEPGVDAPPFNDVNDAEAADPEDSGQEADAVAGSNALGVWAVVAGALLLFPIALVLGHLGLRANARGEATNKSVALAGVILGYIGLGVALVGTALALFVVGPSVDARNTDNAAKVDVINIGNAVLVATAATTEIPTVEIMGSSYEVGSEIVDRALREETTVAVDGSSATDWCVNLSYKGGNNTAVSYSSTAGLVEAPNCGS